MSWHRAYSDKLQKKWTQSTGRPVQRSVLFNYDQQ
jgi:hypothetical protein